MKPFLSTIFMALAIAATYEFLVGAASRGILDWTTGVSGALFVYRDKLTSTYGKSSLVPWNFKYLPKVIVGQPSLLCIISCTVTVSAKHVLSHPTTVIQKSDS